jgi:gamma-glutamylcyclotransferase (GGCT)/AIG2-like uncharacterized protein YtfP
MHNIFVYGTLMSELIINKLTGKTFRWQPATLNGYKRFCVKDCDYPAILTDVYSVTKGLLIENLDDLSLDIISFYEGDEYEKKKVTVSIDGKPEAALTFIWVKGEEYLENENWDFRRFENESLDHYLNVVIPQTLEEFYKK